MLIKCTYKKTTPSSLLKALQQHTIQRRSPANTSLFCSTKWKCYSSLWPTSCFYLMKKKEKEEEEEEEEET